MQFSGGGPNLCDFSGDSVLLVVYYFGREVELQGFPLSPSFHSSIHLANKYCVPTMCQALRRCSECNGRQDGQEVTPVELTDQWEDTVNEKNQDV